MVGNPGLMTEGPMDGLDPLALNADAPTPEGENVVDRDSPEPSEQRKALVDSLSKMVKEA